MHFPGQGRTGKAMRPTTVALILASVLLAVTPAAALSEFPDAAPGVTQTEPGGAPETQTPETAEPLAEIIYDLARLPEPVRRMHTRLLEAARSGDVEALRPYVGLGQTGTQLTLGDMEGDPIAFLKQQSGDEGGQEILAILEEVLTAGFVHMDPGEPDELYVWPYFFAYPIDRLDARQRVELFKIVTAGDYEDMKSFGGYIFYRVGIDPVGQWVFFVAGD